MRQPGIRGQWRCVSRHLVVDRDGVPCPGRGLRHGRSVSRKLPLRLMDIVVAVDVVILVNFLVSILGWTGVKLRTVAGHDGHRVHVEAVPRGGVGDHNGGALPLAVQCDGCPVPNQIVL